MISVLLSDPVVVVKGWSTDMDHLGEFKLKQRKDPTVLKEERRRAREYGRDPSEINQMEYIPGTVITYSDHGRTATFLPGLWPCVKAYLDSKGKAYEVDDRRNPEIRPVPDYSRIKGVQLRKGQPEMLAKVINGDCGIIAGSVGVGKSFIIGLLCKIYPTLNIVVTSSTVSVVNQLYKDIREAVGDDVGLLTGKADKTSGARVIVCTLASLPKIPADKVHLVLVDECHCLGAPSCSKAVAAFRFARRFGFSATPVRNDGLQKVMESLVGPVVFQSTYSEGVSAGSITPIKYTMLTCSSCPSFLLNGTVADWVMQRFAYYRNNARNNLLASAVKAIKQLYSGQILIVVQTVEHAIALHRLLPWFVVAHAEGFDEEAMRVKFEREYPGIDMKPYRLSANDNARILGAFAKGTLRYVISTKIVKQGLNFKHMRCLIRADATASEIDTFQIPGRLSRLDEEKDYGYLIDFNDTFHKLAVAKTVRREAKYKEYKWTKITFQEMLNDLKRADRPGAPGFGASETEAHEPGEAGERAEQDRRG